MDYFQRLGRLSYYKDTLTTYTKTKSTDVLNGIRVEIERHSVELRPYTCTEEVAELLDVPPTVARQWMEHANASGVVVGTFLNPLGTDKQEDVDAPETRMELEREIVDCRDGGSTFMPPPPPDCKGLVTRLKEPSREKFISRAGTPPSAVHAISCPQPHHKGLCHEKNVLKTQKRQKVPPPQLNIPVVELELIDYRVTIGEQATRE